VDANQRIFRIASETSPNTRYTVSLSTHFCDCASTSSTCKHLLALQLIAKEFYQSFNDEVAPSLNANMEPTFEPIVEDVHGQDSVLECVPETSDSDDLLQVIRNMELVLQKVKMSIEKYGEEERKYKMDAIKGCMHSITEPFTFERPCRIILPSKGSILPIQQNVQRTRMGHGRTSKHKDKMEEEKTSLGVQVRPTMTPPPHKLVSTSKRKRTIFPRIPKVICDQCYTRSMIEKGDTIVSCRNCDRHLKCT
jgi:hypothetical protein